MNNNIRLTIKAIISYVFCVATAVSLLFGTARLNTVYAATGTVTYKNKTYTTSDGSDMAYLKTRNIFDFIGNYKGTWKQVTYNTNGFQTILTVGGTKNESIAIDGSTSYDGISVNVLLNFAKDSSLQVSYRITNSSSSSKTFSIGSHADVQIGSLDAAPITPFSQKTDNNKVKGFMMNETSTGAQFNFYARGYAGVTTVDSVWYGRYGDRISNIYSDMGSGSNLTNTDSGMAWSWQNRTIPANTTQTYNVKFIIAELGSENNVASSGTISLIHIGDVQHSFNVYQLMQGTVDPENTYASVMQWGNGITNYATKTGENISTTAGATVPLSALFEIVEGQANTEKTALINRLTLGTPVKSGTSVNGSIAFPNLPCGYYLVRDTTSFGANSTDIVSRDLLIYLDEDGRAIELKRAKPSFDKTVCKSGTADTDWAEAAGYTIGEEYHYKLTASIPADEDFGGYTTYKLVFHDTYSAGIDFNNLVSVNYVVGGVKYEIPADKYQFVPEAGGLTLTIPNFAEVAGDAWGSAVNGIDVNVIYSAKLNKSAPSINQSVDNALYTENAAISSGNAFIEYSNNPTSADLLGETEKDNVGVFTFKLLNTKYANLAKEGYELNGAKFELYKGTYSPENKVQLIYDADAKAYRPVEGAETAAEYMVSGYGLNDDNYKGKLDITGIGAGTYILVETEAPENYTEIDNYTFTFSAETDENSEGTAGVANITVVNGDGSSEGDKGQEILVTLKNNIIDMLVSDKTLPETGGIGTKIFYILGICMIIGAGFTLIIKKRLSKITY